MPRVRGPLHSWAAVGSVGREVTFQQRNGGTVMRVYCRPGQPNSERQKRIRGFFRELQQQWGTLTRDEVSEWRGWASLHPKSRLGMEFFPTGGNRFLGLNLLLRDAGRPARTAGPYYEGAPPLRACRVVVLENVGLLRVEWDGACAHYAGDMVDVWVQGPLLKSGQKFRGVDCRHWDYGEFISGVYVIGDLDVGARYYVAVRGVQEDGQRGPFARFGPVEVA